MTLAAEGGALPSLPFFLRRALQPPLVVFLCRAIRLGRCRGKSNLTGDGQSAVVGSGVATPPSVQVSSRGGEHIPGLRVIFAVTSGGGTVTGATVETDVNGVAAVGGWTLGTQAGVNKLTATVAEVDTGLVFTATGTQGAPAAITKVAGDSQTATVGTVVSVAPTVRVADQYGNAVPGVGVTFAIVGGGGTATGTSAVTDTAGRAAVGSWRLGAQAGANALTATVSSGVAFAATFAATATPPPPARVGFVVQPSAATAGAALTPAVQVAIQDALGNTVTSATNNVLLAITTGTDTSGAVLGGTLTQAAVNGVATFANLTANKVGAGYRLTATANGLTSATSDTFSVKPGPVSTATSLVTVSASSVQSGATATLTLQAKDASGNNLTTGGLTVAFTASTGTGVSTGTIAPSPATDNHNGTYTATFTGVLVGTATTIGATIGGTAITSTLPTLSVTSGAATKLAFTVQPSAVVAGGVMTPVVQVTAEDGSNNTVTSFSGSVTMAITSGTGTTGAAFRPGATATVAAVAGVATFSTLRIDSAGTNYTLTATASSLASVTSTAFVVTTAPPSRLVFLVQPASSTAGNVFSPPIQVMAIDSLGNRTTNSTASIALAITAGTGAARAVLAGTTAQGTVNGVATFANLSIAVAGVGYTLTATSNGVASAVSTVFSITAAALSRIVVTPAGATIATVGGTQQLTATPQDSFGNTLSQAVTWTSLNTNVATISSSGLVTVVATGQVTIAATTGNVRGYALITAAIPGATPVNLWAPTLTGTGVLNSIWGTSSSNIYAVDGLGAILTYNGTSWTTVRNASGTTLDQVLGVLGLGRLRRGRGWHDPALQRDRVERSDEWHEPSLVQHLGVLGLGRLRRGRGWHGPALQRD